MGRDSSVLEPHFAGSIRQVQPDTIQELFGSFMFEAFKHSICKGMPRRHVVKNRVVDKMSRSTSYIGSDTWIEGQELNR